MKKIVVIAASTVLSTMILAVSASAMVNSHSSSIAEVAPSVGTYIDTNRSAQVAGLVQVPPPLSTIKFAPEVNVAGPVQVPPPLSTIKFAPEVNVAGPVQVPPPLSTIKFAPEVNVAGPVQVPPPLSTIKFAAIATA